MCGIPCQPEVLHLMANFIRFYKKYVIRDNDFFDALECS